MNLSISEEVLALLVCPKSHQALHLATAAELKSWQELETLEGALITEDGSRAYPIRDGFPILVLAESLTNPASESASE